MTEVPTLIKILAILEYIGSGFTIFSGLALIFGGFLVTTIISLIIPSLSQFAAYSAILLAIIVIALGVLGIFVGRGLWKGKNWARVLAIVFSLIGILVSLISIATGNFMNVISLLIEGALAAYLLFSKKVKEAFKKV